METTTPPLYHWIDRFDAMRAERRFGWLNDVAALCFVLGMLMLLAALPVPPPLTQMSGLLDWAMLMLLAVVVYYFILSLPLALALLPVVTVLAAITMLGEQLPASRSLVGTTLLVVALILDWICQRSTSLRGLVEFSQLCMLQPLWRFHHAVQRKP